MGEAGQGGPVPLIKERPELGKLPAHLLDEHRDDDRHHVVTYVICQLPQHFLIQPLHLLFPMMVFKQTTI
ncbi:hypothetical protein D3C75_494650 [compost metagenome]